MRILGLTGLTSTQASDYRLKRFKEARCPHHDLIATARINALSPLTVGKFMWAFYDDEVVLTQGKCFHLALLTQLTNPATSYLFILKVWRPGW